MPGERYSHLFLPGPSDVRDDYSSPRRGGEEPRLRVQDRPTHARDVIQRLRTAWANATNRQAVAHADRHGVYLEFCSEPGFDLYLKSLEARRSGIRLLNVKTEGDGENEITRATVYIPQSKSAFFIQKAIAYANENNPPKKDGTTTPKNASLINSIGDVRAVILESSFWQDAVARIPGAAPDWVEAWLSSEDLAVFERFSTLCASQGIPLGQGRLTFPERTVVLIRASRAHLNALTGF